ncbi:MAG: hypothetical protein RMM17_01020 [Acidobacteriota bacterium]|nr:hypothetical protein [Blastocatellia bacterium]MDW8411249.1 hypothetical protein [Acidobacteriota bacterium]
MNLYDAQCASCGTRLGASTTNLCATCLWDSNGVHKERNKDFFRNLRRLDRVLFSIKKGSRVWKEQLCRAWESGKKEGFPIGEERATSTEALVSEGYEVVAEADGLTLGTDGISLIAVRSDYGPWAVNVTKWTLDNM